MVEQKLNEFNNPKIIKEKIALHKGILSLENQWNSLASKWDIPHNHFTVDTYNLPTIDNNHMPLEKYQMMHDETKSELVDLKELTAKLEKDKLEKEKLQQELDKIDELYLKLTKFDFSNNVTHDDYNLYVSTSENDDSKPSISYSLEFLEVNVYKHDEYQTDATIIIKNSDNKTVYTKNTQKSIHTDIIDLPYGKYKFKIKYSHVDDKYSGNFEHHMYHFTLTDKLLTNAEKIDHLQKQLKFVQDYN